MDQKIGTWEVFHYPEPKGRWDWECSECGNLQTFRTRHCERCKCEMADGLEIRIQEEEDSL